MPRGNNAQGSVPVGHQASPFVPSATPTHLRRNWPKLDYAPARLPTLFLETGRALCVMKRAIWCHLVISASVCRMDVAPWSSTPGVNLLFLRLGYKARCRPAQATPRLRRSRRCSTDRCLREHRCATRPFSYRRWKPASASCSKVGAYNVAVDAVHHPASRRGDGRTRWTKWRRFVRAEQLSDLESLEEVPAWLPGSQPDTKRSWSRRQRAAAFMGIPAMARASATLAVLVAGSTLLLTSPASCLRGRGRWSALLFYSRHGWLLALRPLGELLAALWAWPWPLSLGCERDSLRDGNYAISRSSWAGQACGLAWGLALALLAVFVPLSGACACSCCIAAGAVRLHGCYRSLVRSCCRFTCQQTGPRRGFCECRA